MILSRVIEHVKAQNWTAIFIDFVIVVVGVFIGIQVSNLNAARAERQRADALVQRLDVEFNELRAELAAALASAKEREIAAGRVLTVLQSGDPDIDEAAMRRDLDMVISPNLAPRRSVIYLQMISAGDLNLIRNDQLANALIRYDQYIDRSERMFSGHLEALAGGRSLYDATTMSLAIDDRGVDRALRSIDIEELKGARSDLEVILQYQGAIRGTLEALIDANDKISALLAGEARK